MATVAQNLNVIRGAVVNLNAQTRKGRNDSLRDYYSHLTPAIQSSLTYSHGSQVYRDKTLGTFLDLINKRPVHMPVKFIGGDDNQLLAQAANDMSNLVYTRASTVRDTGQHVFSLTMYQRAVGQKTWHLIPGRVTASSLPERAIVSILAPVSYASTLEARGVAQGILYYAAKQLRSRYGKQLAVKYDYVSGASFGMGGGTFPRIQIGHYGNLRPKFQTPGRTAKRRSRGYAQVKGRSA